MPLLTSPAGFRWKSVQVIEWEWYMRYRDTTTYTVDVTLSHSVNPDRCVIDIIANNGYDHTNEGGCYGTIQMHDANTVRVQYIADSQHDGGLIGPRNCYAVVYENLKPFRSSQFVTTAGANISLVQQVDWKRAWFTRNFFMWHAARTLGAWMKPIDSGHIAQGHYPDWTTYYLAEHLLRTHIVEF